MGRDAESVKDESGERVVHSVIPTPSSRKESPMATALENISEKLNLNDFNITINLSEDQLTSAGDMKEDVLNTLREETWKTRMVLIVLGCLNAIGFVIAAFL